MSLKWTGLHQNSTIADTTIFAWLGLIIFSGFNASNLSEKDFQLFENRSKVTH